MDETFVPTDGNLVVKIDSQNYQSSSGAVKAESVKKSDIFVGAEIQNVPAEWTHPIFQRKRRIWFLKPEGIQLHDDIYLLDHKLIRGYSTTKPQ